MFANVTWEMLGVVAACAAIGLILRTFGPYCRVSYNLIKSTNEWKLPRFEPQYILAPAATLGVLIVGALTVKDLIPTLYNLGPAAIILGTYLGQGGIREELKKLTGV